MAKSDFWFHHLIRVRYAEVDAQAIVYFGNYMTYFDTAHTEYMRALPFDYQEHIERFKTDFHIVKVAVEYLAPARFDDQVEVYVRTSYIGRSSMRVCFEVYPAGDDTLITAAEFVTVNASQATMRPAPWPEELIRVIEERELTAPARP